MKLLDAKTQKPQSMDMILYQDAQDDPQDEVQKGGENVIGIGVTTTIGGEASGDDNDDDDYPKKNKDSSPINKVEEKGSIATEEEEEEESQIKPIVEIIMKIPIIETPTST